MIIWNDDVAKREAWVIVNVTIYRRLMQFAWNMPRLAQGGSKAVIPPIAGEVEKIFLSYKHVDLFWSIIEKDAKNYKATAKYK